MTQEAYPRWRLGVSPSQHRKAPETVARHLELVEGDLTLGVYGRYVKPVLDRLGGVVLSILTLPVVVLLMVIIRVWMGPPALFTQDRVGKNGRVFALYKLRTMRHDRRNGPAKWDGPERRQCHKTPNDPRHTKLGAFLRKWSLDELPQFWNVARGHMSLVGPRPELVEIVETKYEPWQPQRHPVEPGITGLWQVSARDDDRLMYEHTDIDLRYLESITFLGDLKILLLTVPAALGYRTGR